MEQPLTDRDRTLLAATIEDLASRVSEQRAYSIAIHDGRDQGSHNIRSCTRLLRIIILPPNRVQCPQLNPF